MIETGEYLGCPQLGEVPHIGTVGRDVPLERGQMVARFPEALNVLDIGAGEFLEADRFEAVARSC
jgi:hypothetical protein